MEDQHGNKQTDKTKILQIFQDRYNKVFQARDKEATTYNDFLSNTNLNINRTRYNIYQSYSQIKHSFEQQNLEQPNNVSNSPIIQEEITSALKSSKKNISSGHTNISSEALQKGGPLLTQALPLAPAQHIPEWPEEGTNCQPKISIAAWLHEVSDAWMDPASGGGPPMCQ